MKTWNELEREMPFVRHAKGEFKQILEDMVGESRKVPSSCKRKICESCAELRGRFRFRQEMLDKINKFFSE